MMNFTIYRTAVGQDISPIKPRKFMGAEYTRLAKLTQITTNIRRKNCSNLETEMQDVHVLPGLSRLRIRLSG
jgi:hypothetical protein